MNRLSRGNIFILSIFSFELFSALFSHRPYVHYLLLLLPSTALLFGSFLEYKNIRAVVLILIGTLIGIIYTSFSFNTYTDKYYINFLKYITGRHTQTEYFISFDPHVPQSYRIAEYISHHIKPEDRIFIWGDEAYIYKLANTPPPIRYVVAYHVVYSPQRLQEVNEAIRDIKPRFIIVIPPYSYPFSLDQYTVAATIDNAIIYKSSDFFAER